MNLEARVDKLERDNKSLKKMLGGVAAIAAEKIKLEREKIALEREKMEADVALKRMEIEIKAAESATRSAA